MINFRGITERFNIKKLFKNEYARDASTLMVGTTLGMVIQLLASPLLARIYDDSAFGILQLFSSTYAILAIIATLRYELAILLPKSDDDAFSVLMASCASTVIFSVLCQLFVAAVKIFDISVFGLNRITWLKYVPASALIYGLYYSFNYWLNRRKRYFNLAINRILQNLLIVVFSVLFSGTLLNINDGMIISYLAAMGFVTILLIFYAFQDYRRLSIKLSVKSVFSMAKRYRRFPINTMPTGLINNVAANMPVFILRYFFGDGVVGQYYMMTRVLGTPVSIIGQAIGDVFRQRSSSTYAERGECKNIYVSTTKALAGIAVVPFVILMLIARPAIVFLLGDQWKMAGMFIVLLAPFYFIRLVVSPLTSMTIVAEKQTFELIWQIGLCILTSAALIISCIMIPADGSNIPYYVAMSAYALVYSVMYILHFLYTRQLARGKKLWG